MSSGDDKNIDIYSGGNVRGDAIRENVMLFRRQAIIDEAILPNRFRNIASDVANSSGSPKEGEKGGADDL